MRACSIWKRGTMPGEDPFPAIRRDLRQLKWMVGTTIVLEVLILFKVMCLI